MHCAPNSSPVAVNFFPATSVAPMRAATGRSSIPYSPRTERQPSLVSSTVSLVHSIFGSTATIPASSTSMIATRSGTPICGAAIPMPRATTMDANIRATSASSSGRARRGFFATAWSTGSPIWRTSTAFADRNSGVDHFVRRPLSIRQGEPFVTRSRGGGGGSFGSAGGRGAGPDRDSLSRAGAPAPGLRREEHGPPEWRVAEAAASFELDRREARVIVRRGSADRVVLRQVRLQDPATARGPAPRAPEDLRQQLERALGRREVRQVQDGVGVHDADERDARQVEALREHLRPHDHLGLSRPHALVGRGVRAFRTDRVAIETDDRCARDGRAHLLLDTLRAHTQLLETRAPAGGAGPRHPRPAAAPRAAPRHGGGAPPHVGGLRPPAPRLHVVRGRDLAGGAEEHGAPDPAQGNG